MGIYIGIDPGFEGSLCVLDEGKLIAVYDMPVFKTEGTKKTPKGNLQKKTNLDMQGIISILAPFAHPHDINNNNVHVCIEALNAGVFAKSKNGEQRTMGVVSAFGMGKGWGQLLGIIAALGIPYTEVHPATWKAAVLAGMDKSKTGSVSRACQLFPEKAHEFSYNRGKVQVHKDGRAEAALMAFYLYRQTAVGNKLDPSNPPKAKNVNPDPNLIFGSGPITFGKEIVVPKPLGVNMGQLKILKILGIP